jgi:hypothetical protein
MADEPRPIKQIASDLETIRHSLMPVIRRLHRTAAAETDRERHIQALYEDVPGMRACAQTLTAIVDDMCRLCFPVAITPLRKSILTVVMRKAITKVTLVSQMCEFKVYEDVGPSEILANIDTLIEARYLRLLGEGSLIATATGRAAQAGIFWAQPERTE